MRASTLTLFGLGQVPTGATLASLVALAVWRACLYLGWSATSLRLLALAVVVMAVVELRLRAIAGDPRHVVVDEFLGMLAALLFLPSPDLLAAAGLFVAFRVLDIVKIPPFSWIDRWKHPLAILLDDIAIGVALGGAYRLMLWSLRLAS